MPTTNSGDDHDANYGQRWLQGNRVQQEQNSTGEFNSTKECHSATPPYTFQHGEGRIGWFWVTKLVH